MSNSNGFGVHPKYRIVKTEVDTSDTLKVDYTWGEGTSTAFPNNQGWRRVSSPKKRYVYAPVVPQQSNSQIKFKGDPFVEDREEKAERIAEEFREDIS